MEKNSKTVDKSKKAKVSVKLDPKINGENKKTKKPNGSPTQSNLIKPLTEKVKRLSFKYDLKFQDLRIKENRIRIAKESYLKNKRGGLLSKIFFRPAYEEEILPEKIVEEMKINNTELEKVLNVLTKPYLDRSSKDNEILLNFLLKTKIYDVIKNDLIETELSINELFDVFKNYISCSVYNYYDTVYYMGEESDKLYLLLKGNISQYKLIFHEENLTSEEYYLFLYYNYVRCEQLKEKTFNNFKNNDEEIQEYIAQIKKNNINSNKSSNNIVIEPEENKDVKEILFLKEDEYADDFLLYQISEENKEMFPLESFDDIDKLNKILLKIRLYSLLIESGSNSINIIDCYIKYHVPLSFLGYKKVLDNKMTEIAFLKKVTDSIQNTERFYMRYMSDIKQKVKLSKYVKENEITPYNYFGNFEIINCDPVRECTMKCECDECILLNIHKKMYSAILYEQQKTKRENEINIFHFNYIFKNISYNYFVQKIFSLFEIKNLFKGDSLFTQGKNSDNFIFIKEGIVEICLENISFIDIIQLIKKTKDIIYKKAKDYSININEIIDFDTNIDLKLDIPYKLIKETLSQTQNFIFSRSENGFFGDYEFCFNTCSLLSGKVFSDNCVAYFFSYDKYRCLNEETYILNESLKYSSFNKMKNILKRLINVYHSYWKLNQRQLNKEMEYTELLNKAMDKNNLTDENLFNSPKKQLLQSTKISPVLKLIKNIKDGGKSDSEGGNDILSMYLNNSNTINSKIFKTSLDFKKYNTTRKMKTQENVHDKIRSIKRKMMDKEILKKRKFNLTNRKIYKNEDAISQNVNINKDEKKIFESDFFAITKYQKELLTDFKNIMDSQRRKEKRNYKKEFLPPIMNVPNKLYNYKLFSKGYNIANVNLKTETNSPEIKNYCESYTFNRRQEKIRNSKRNQSDRIRFYKLVTADFKYAYCNMMRSSNYRRSMIKTQKQNEISFNKSLDENNY